MSILEVKVPDIGDIAEVKVIELMVRVSDTVKVDQPIVTVESDKASMEIPSSHSGVVKEIKVKLGDTVTEGSCVLLLDTESSADAPKLMQAIPSPTPDAHPASLMEKHKASSGKPVGVIDASKIPYASPSVRKFARESGVNLREITGTGAKHRILREDVQKYIDSTLLPATSVGTTTVLLSNNKGGTDLLAWPSLDFTRQGKTELLPLSRIKKISGPNLQRNWAVIPHVTQFDEADISGLEEFRKQSNAAYANAENSTKLTILSFVIKACVTALKKFPEFNASLDSEGKNIILKHYYNIGFAVDTPNGLVVAVIKHSDSKSIKQIAKEISELSAQARDGKIKIEDMQEATFTISSLGGIGGTSFTPIINAPEVAILGLSKASLKPFWDGSQFVPKLMMPTSLSYDHRAVDGVTAARFSVYLSSILADIRKILL